MTWRRPVFLFITGLWATTHCRALQYHFVSFGLPWFKAQTFCREQYTDLVSVFDVEDTNRLVNTVQDSTGGFKAKVWIGLYDNFTSWRWSSSDSRFYGDKESNYRNWGVSQPDNFAGDQMCVKTWGGGTWEDAQCSLRYPFICYDESTSTGERFIFVEQKMSWSDAQVYCRRLYTDLASVRDEKENVEIQQLSKDRGVWIGLYRTREWSDRSASTYRNWKSGQPDNFRRRENCTAADVADAGLWSDEDCSRELAFVCYKKNGLSTTAATTEATTSTSTTSSKEGTTAEKTTSSPEYVINLRATFTSTEPLSQDDIKELVLVKFHKLLIEKGLPASIEVGLRTPLK